MAEHRVRFQYGPRCDGGHSLLKIVAFDHNGKSIEIPDRYTYNGKLSPESGKQVMWISYKDFLKGVFDNFQMAMDEALKKWDALPKINVAHGYISCSDKGVGGRAGTIYREFRNVSMRPVNASFRYALRVKLSTGRWEEWRTLGEVDYRTAEVREDRNACFRDLQAQFSTFATRNPDLVRGIENGLVWGDGKGVYSDTKNFELYKHSFEPRLMRFFDRRRGGAHIQIHDPAVMAMHQDFEEQWSNMTANLHR